MMTMQSNQRKPNLVAAALACGLAAVLGGPPAAQAQLEENDPAPLPGQFEATPLPPQDQLCLVPDVPSSLLDQTQCKDPWFTLKWGLRRYSNTRPSRRMRP